MASLLELLRDKNFSLYQCEGLWVLPLVGMAARLRRRPCLVHEHNLPFAENGSYSRPMRVIGRLCFELSKYLADLLIVSTPEERSLAIQAGYDEDRLTIVPHGVDLHDQGPSGRSRTVLFIGDFNWPPNREAAKTLVEAIVPIVVEKQPAAKFRLVGPNPPLEYAHPSVEYAGWVPDIEPILRESLLGIAPLWSGGGMATKTLTYLSAGLPVVATSRAVEGLELQEGIHYVRGDNPEEFAEGIVTLLKSPEVARRIGEEGRLAVNRNYSWTSVVARLEGIYRGVLSRTI